MFSLSAATPRSVLLRIRASVFLEAVLEDELGRGVEPPWEEGFTVWNAGRDGKQVGLPEQYTKTGCSLACKSCTSTINEMMCKLCVTVAYSIAHLFRRIGSLLCSLIIKVTSAQLPRILLVTVSDNAFFFVRAKPSVTPRTTRLQIVTMPVYLADLPVPNRFALPEYMLCYKAN
jgi:hypothetical protein